MSTVFGRIGSGVRPTAWRPLYPAWVALAAVTLAVAGLHTAGVRVPMRAQGLAYLVGMAAVNLPHGGVEHLANLRRRSPRFQAGYAVAFLALVAGFVALLFAAPALGLVLMVAVACAKGGLGGVAALDAVVGADHLRTRPQRWLAAAVRGAVVMVVPYVAFPGTFSAFAGYMVGVFDPEAFARLAWAFDPGVRRAALAVLGVGVFAHLALGAVRDPGTGTWLADAVETGLLVAYFWTVPVVLAVGLYFPLWYTARQAAREWVAESERPTAESAWLVDGRPRVTAVLNVGAFVAGAGLTALVLGALYVLVPRPAGGAPTWLAGGVVFYTVFVSVIALPHVVVGGVVDDRGIWFVP